jgi:hypothetical protein
MKTELRRTLFVGGYPVILDSKKERNMSDPAIPKGIL